MATYYVDDAGSNTSPFDTWAKAATSIFNLPSLGSGDIVYIAKDMIDTTSYSAHQTLTGPSSGLPAIIISVTQGTTTYSRTTAKHIDTAQAGSYAITFTGGFACYGISISYGSNFTVNSNSEFQRYHDCDFYPGHGRAIICSHNGGFRIEGGKIDAAADTGASTTQLITVSGLGRLSGVVFANASNRSTRAIIHDGNVRYVDISGCDFSSLTHASVPAIIEYYVAKGRSVLSHCKTPSTHKLYSVTAGDKFSGVITNTGPGNQPTQMTHVRDEGEIWNSTTVYRSGGMTIEGTNVSLGGPTTGIETNAECSFDAPLVGPWVPVPITSTGTKTFDVFIANNNGNLLDTEIWFEVEVKANTTSGLWSRYTNKPAKGATGSAHATDGSSTWNGDTFTYKQKMSLGSVPVNTTGLCRMRIILGKTSIPSSHDIYVDPLPVVA